MSRINACCSELIANTCLTTEGGQGDPSACGLPGAARQQDERRLREMGLY